MSSPLWEGVREGCGTCAFAGPPSASKQHECRLKPPTMLVLRYAPGVGDGHNQVEQHRPWMSQSDWCGEYKRNTSA